MSTKKKLLISLCSLCLVAAVVVIGVFAFATQTLTITNKLTYTATQHVEGTITVSAKHKWTEGDTAKTEDIDLNGDKTEGNDYVITIGAGSKVTATNPLPDISFKDVSSDSVALASIEFTFTIKNTGTEANNSNYSFNVGYNRATTADTTTTNAAYTSEVTTGAGGISEGAITGTPTAVAVDGSLTITVEYAVTNVLKSASLQETFSFLLESVVDAA